MSFGVRERAEGGGAVGDRLCTTVEASAAVAKLDSELPVETMVREALKTLVKPMSNPYK